MSKKKYIILLIISSILLAVCCWGLIYGISTALAMIRLYPRPLDSFWSMDRILLLFAFFSVLASIAAYGIVFSVLTLKNGNTEQQKTLGKKQIILSIVGLVVFAIVIFCICAGICFIAEKLK